MSLQVEQIPDWLEACLSGPVAILGAGVSGRGVQDLINNLGGDVVLFDRANGPGINEIFDREAARAAKLVVYSPGFPVDHAWIALARSEGCQVIAEFDLGGILWNGPIIAITGTNGKTTLASFLNEAFSHVGIESYAVGNIGRPLCKLLSEGSNSEAIAVCEISSFQAETLKYLHADHVLWTNFDEDHLDRHGSIQSYFRSKYNLIAKSRGNSLFIDRTVFEFGKQIGLDLPLSSVVADIPNVESLGLQGSVFETLPELNTYLMARSLWLSLKLSEKELLEAAHLFAKAPHRMEFLGEKSGIGFWNDSKATNFHAVIGGLSRFEKPVLWIGGGEGKGGDIGKFAGRLARFIKSAALIGETRSQLRAELYKAGCPASEHGSLEEAVNKVIELAERGDNVVLSPGFASFDMFENYAERGEAFRKAVDCS